MVKTGCWDYPFESDKSNFGTAVGRCGSIPLHGWALGDEVKILIKVDGTLIDSIHPSFCREDIEIIFFSQLSGKTLHGWSYELDTQKYSEDFHEIQIDLTFADKSTLFLGKRKISFARSKMPDQIEEILKKDGVTRIGNQFFYPKLNSTIRPKNWVEHPTSSFGLSPQARDIIGKSKGLTLIVGAGFCPVLDNVIQMDIFDYPNIDVVSEEFPFINESFDNIFCENVIEHVPNPFQLIAELKRLLKPGGTIGINGTNLHFTHGFPSHYFNPTEFGMRHLLDSDFLGSYNFVDPASSMHTILKYYLNSLGSTSRSILSRLSMEELLEKIENRDAECLNAINMMADPAKKAISTGIYFLGNKRI